MKTVRTRVKSAFNPKRTATKPSNDFQEDAIVPSLDSAIASSFASASGPSPSSSLPEQKRRAQDLSAAQPFTPPLLPPPPPPVLVSVSQPLAAQPSAADSDRDRGMRAMTMAKPYISEFHLDSDPFADLSSSPLPLQISTSSSNSNSNSAAPLTNTSSNKTRRSTVTLAEITVEKNVYQYPPPLSAAAAQSNEVEVEIGAGAEAGVEKNTSLDFDESQGQTITITDDSRRSTPKKKKKSVPRASPASLFTSPSITSRILTVIPPPGLSQAQVELDAAPGLTTMPTLPTSTTTTTTSRTTTTSSTIMNQDVEPKIESSPVNVNLSYLAHEPERGQSLLDQPQPTESAFHEITPPQGIQPMPVIPPLHEILLNTEKYQQQIQQRTTDSPLPLEIQSDHLAPFNPNDESKPLLDPSFQTSELDHILEHVPPFPPLYTVTSQNKTDYSRSSTVWPLPPQTFPTLGWTEHVLPSSAYYYSHAATRTVTDIDLRDNKKLDALMRYLEVKRSTPTLSSNSNLNLKVVGDGIGIGNGDGNGNGNGGAVDTHTLTHARARDSGFDLGINPSGSSGRDTNTIRTLRTEPEFLAEEGIDIWIRDANANGNTNTTATTTGSSANGTGSGGVSNVTTVSEWPFMPLTNWVMHATRAVSYDRPSDKDPAPEDLSDTERLSLEYRYWQYMSTHPAHVSIPQAAYDEALEVLTWCYTDSVLRGSDSGSPPIRHFPPPFTFSECTALLELIRNISSSVSSQTIRTRLVAQILLRYNEWRQKYIIRSIPAVLPPDSNTNSSNNTVIGRTANGNAVYGYQASSTAADTEAVEHAVPFKKTVETFVKSILCLGIPYLFERNYYHDGNYANEEEQGELELERAAVRTGKISNSRINVPVGIDASQPILAALVLSGAVTMLTFPNLNQTTRISAMISTLFAITCMAAYGISLYARSRRDSNSSSPLSNYEREHGVRMNQNQRYNVPGSITVSVPLVLLIYSLCAFVTGILAYAIGGSSSTTGAVGGRVTGWVILAVWVALVGILVAFAACSCLRR